MQVLMATWSTVLEMGNAPPCTPTWKCVVPGVGCSRAVGMRTLRSTGVEMTPLELGVHAYR